MYIMKSIDVSFPPAFLCKAFCFVQTGSVMLHQGYPCLNCTSVTPTHSVWDNSLLRTRNYFREEFVYSDSAFDFIRPSLG